MCDKMCAVHADECNIPGKEEAAAGGGGQTSRRCQKDIAAERAEIVENNCETDVVCPSPCHQPQVRGD